ncbi:MAG: MFS transporter [Deltaproteobacteria bacterium]|nr:MFS transporter [Deltaproteobacteria bacterium]
MTPSEQTIDTNNLKPEDTPSLRASIHDGVSHAVMMGSGETYLGPFGIFLRASTLQVGLLASLPQLFGAVMQWVGAIKMDRIHSRRRVIITGASIQASTLIPMALLPFIFGKGTWSILFLLALIMVYQGANGGVVPVWNSLIGDLIPTNVRGRFFGHRNRLTGMATFGSLLPAGILLYIFERAGIPEWGFLVIFSIAFLARLNSVRWLSKYADPDFQIRADQVFTFRQFIKRSPHSNFAKFVFFIGAINFSVAFSAPYFALYMLRDLQFSYIEFTLVTGAATVTQFLTFRYWGGLSDRFGNKKILNLCGWGVAVVPILWLVSPQIFYLIVIQIYGGLVWSGFSLAFGNFLFDAVTPPKRARCVAYQGLINGGFVFMGSVLGGYAAGHLPSSISLGPWTWTPAFMLPMIFLLSGFMRLVAAGIFLRKFKEVRSVEPIRHRDLIFRISHIRPIAGATFSLFTGLFVEHKEMGKKGHGDEMKAKNSQ